MKLLSVENNDNSNGNGKIYVIKLNGRELHTMRGIFLHYVTAIPSTIETDKIRGHLKNWLRVILGIIDRDVDINNLRRIRRKMYKPKL